jgi:hypothetical protein
MTDNQMRVTGTIYVSWNNFTSASSCPLHDVATGVAWVQSRSEGHDPELISIRHSAWAALLAHPDSRSYVIDKGYSIEAFKRLTGARDVRIFADESPCEYDLCVRRGDVSFELVNFVPRR